MPFARRAQRTAEYVDAMRTVWRDDVASFSGSFVDFASIRVNPKPVRNRRIPIVLGGNSDAALRRVVAWGDGWYGFNLDDVAAVADRVQFIDGCAATPAGTVRTPVGGRVTAAADADVSALAELGIDELVIVEAPPDDAALVPTGWPGWRGAGCSGADDAHSADLRPARADDGVRVLADRLWPRGVRKDDPRIDRWIKDVAPSSELRRWYNHDLERYDEFVARYEHELEEPIAAKRSASFANSPTPDRSPCSRRRRTSSTATSSCSSGCWENNDDRAVGGRCSSATGGPGYVYVGLEVIEEERWTRCR